MTPPRSDDASRPETPARGGVLYFGFPYPVTAVLLLLAAWFLVGPSIDVTPELAVSTFDQQRLSFAPPREVMSDPPTILAGGYARKCSDCHAIFDTADQDLPGDRDQHGDIVLRHGLNDRCYNCHAYEDHDRLVLHGGDLIGYDETHRLCAKCHGTVFRDWQAGMHGRTNGSWQRDSEAFRRLTCVECHDPHSPAYAPMEPMPAPNTLRQGPQDVHGSHHASESPLQQWQRALQDPEHRSGSHGDGNAAPDGGKR